jgi:hypothetical protein
MPRKTVRPTFDQCVGTLRQRGFEVSPFQGIAGGILVAKYGAAAVLTPTTADPETEGSPAAFAEHPGILVKGEIARLLDRGYQKFIRTSQFELPATAAQLHAIHQFQEELTQAVSGTSLYNQSLGTTSDLYEYDRLRGREQDAESSGRRPWDLTDGH